MTPENQRVCLHGCCQKFYKNPYLSKYLLIKAEREIFPVGHGGFCLEKIRGRERIYMVIYDCGSKSTQVINTAIDQLYHELNLKTNEKPRIDAVFISHFHEDHVNGLKHLKQNFNIGKIFIPVLSEIQITNEAEKLLGKINKQHRPAMLEFLQQEFESEKKCYNSIIELFDKQAIVFIQPVDPTENEEDHKTNNDSNRYDLIEANTNKERHQNTYTSWRINDDQSITMDSGTEISIKETSIDNQSNIIWCYRPFNIETPMKLVKDLLLAIDSKCPSDLDIKKLRKIYQKHLGNGGQALNRNSQVVFSEACLSDPSKMKLTGALYLGDYVLKNDGLNQLRLKCNKNFANIGLLQIPHHGADANFDADITQNLDDETTFFVQAPNSDPNHPGKNVSAFLDSRLLSYVVTNQLSSYLRQTICFYDQATSISFNRCPYGCNFELCPWICLCWNL